MMLYVLFFCVDGLQGSKKAGSGSIFSSEKYFLNPP